MPVNQPSQQDLNAAIRKVFNDLESSLNNLGELKKFLDGKTANDLKAAGGLGYDYTQADIDNMKAAIFDTNYNALVNAARDANAGPLTFLRRVAGVNFERR